MTPNIGIAIIFLISFYGFTLSGPYSLGKLVAVTVFGLWLALGPVLRLGVAPLFYLLAAVVSTLLSADPWLSVWGLWGTYNTGLICAMVLIPYWACVDSRHRFGLEVGLRWGGLIMAVVGLAQRVGFFLPFPLPAGDRAYSTMGSPVYVGAMAALCFPFCKTWLERGLMIALLWATGSRGAWIATALGAIYFYWPDISRRVRIWGLVAAGSVTALAFWIRPLSDLGRVVVWGAAWEAFKARPWFGWGPGNYLTIAEVYRNPAWDEVYGVTTQDHAHNLFLEAAATGGIVGLVAMSVLTYTMWIHCRYSRMAQAALLGVFCVGLLNPLPLVAKALCLALCASSSSTNGEINKKVQILCKQMFLVIFVSVLYITHWDRMVTYYGDTPWSFSSVKAAFNAGIIKQKIERRNFKL